MSHATTHRQKMISKIHIAKKQLGLDDDVYRGLLSQATGLHSCKDMDDNQLAAVLNLLQQKGFGADAGAQGYQRTPLHFAGHGAMMRKIGARHCAQDVWGGDGATLRWRADAQGVGGAELSSEARGAQGSLKKKPTH